MKKKLYIKAVCSVLVGTLMLGLVGCGNPNNKETTAENKPNETTGTQSTEAEPNTDGETSSGDVALTYPLDTDVTFTMYAQGAYMIPEGYKTFDESPWHQGLETVTGVKVEWEYPGENLDLRLAVPEDRPDVFGHGGISNEVLSGYIADDVIIDLTDLLPVYAPDLWEYIHKDEYTLKSFLTDDGRLWFVPGMRENKGMTNYIGPVIRKDWLQECGLDMPVTMEDWEEVLVKFNEKYGAKFVCTYGDLKGYSFASGTGAMSAITNRLFVDDNGKIQSANIQPEWKELISYLAKWYKMGLIDEDTFTADRAIIRQKVLSGETGLLFTAQSQLTVYDTDATENNTGAEWVGVSYPRTEAGAPTTMIQYGSSLANGYKVCITTNCDEEKIPTILAWMNYPYTEAGMKYYNFGQEGVSYTLDDNGTPQWTDLVEKHPNGKEVGIATWSMMPGQCIGVQMFDFVNSRNLPIAVEAQKIWIENTDAGKHLVPTLTLTEDEALTYSDIWAACNTFVEESALAFITGEKSLDEFDAYVQELNKMGLPEAIAIQQAAFDRFMSK